MANEVRLIDAYALLEVLKEEHDRVMQDPEISKAVKWGEAVINYRVLKAIEDSHTVDAVEVVRCEDCRRFKCADDGIFYCYRNKLGPGVFMRKTDFCSYGERRTDNEVYSSDPCHL